MGADAPMPPVVMNAAGGTPPRRINNVAPPCLGEALRRGALAKFLICFTGF
jgi:hypothetical protein